MKRAAVYIATTEGPSEIQRITPEDSDVRSVICHDGKAIALPISPDYDAFVRRPTGIIEACFGHSAYRVDIADPIASGSSWQLGLFIAHALFDESQLTRTDDKNTRIVWATGEVSRDLTVAEVQDVDRKIRQSASRIRHHIDGGARVVLAVPAGNLDEATRALEDVFAGDLGRLQIVPAETVGDALSALGLKHRRRVRRWLDGRSLDGVSRRRWSRQAAIAGSAALVAFTAFIGWQKFGSQVDLGLARAHAVRLLPASLRPNPIATLTAETVMVRPPVGEPCAAVYLGRSAPLKTHRAVIEGAPVAASRATDLCDFRYRLTNRLEQPVTLWVLATRQNSNGGAFRLRALHAARSLAAGGTISLDARPPRRFAASLRQELVVVSIPSGTAAGRGGLGTLWHRASNATSARDLVRLLDQARGQGAAVLRLTHEFKP